MQDYGSLDARLASCEHDAGGFCAGVSAQPFCIWCFANPNPCVVSMVVSCVSVVGVLIMSMSLVPYDPTDTIKYDTVSHAS